jgi:hypothetical protein
MFFYRIKCAEKDLFLDTIKRVKKSNQIMRKPPNPAKVFWAADNLRI